MRDVIYDALVEFNESVNPFFADWGLPALIKRFMPIGSGAVLKSMSAVRTEFDKRLEPEIRKFLLGFSRKSKKKLADFIVSSAGDPKLVALRKSIVAFFYEESLAQITQNVDDDARMEVDEAARGNRRSRSSAGTARASGSSPSSRSSSPSTATRPSGRGSRASASPSGPNLEQLAELLWPYVRLALESPPARAFYERVTGTSMRP